MICSFLLLKGSESTEKRFDLYMPIELFDRIKLLAKNYSLSITQMIIRLLEFGYIEFYKQDYKERD